MGVNFSLGYALFTALHVALFALGLTVCGLYGKDLKRAQDSGKDGDSKWIYAVVVGALSAVTCIVYFVPLVIHRGGLVIAGWDFVLFVLWVALFGVFGSLYIHEDPEGDGAIQRMKNAVWVDLANMLLWFIAFVAMLGYWWKNRDRRSLFTGRAHV